MREPAFRSIGATTFLAPLPVVLVGAADPGHPERPGNLITVAWSGICCTKPPMLTLSLKPERYSYDLIRRSGECTVNLVTREMARAADLCGVRSGRDTDKFALTGLMPVPAEGLSAPAVGESPVHLCCLVERVEEPGSHHLFLCRVAQVRVGEKYFTASGSIDMRAMHLCCYAHGEYFSLAESLGFFGFSVAGKDAMRRRG